MTRLQTFMRLCSRRQPHVHRFVPIGDIKAEIDERDPVRHTRFGILGCPECRAVEYFPTDNFALCTERFVDALRRELIAQGWKP